jgi:hypothetical protein
MHLDKSHQEALAKRKIDGTHLQVGFLSRLEVCRKVTNMDRTKYNGKPADFAQSECGHPGPASWGTMRVRWDTTLSRSDSLTFLATSSVLKLFFPAAHQTLIPYVSTTSSQ